MVNTRRESPSTAYDKLLSKIDKSKLSIETKEIFNIIINIFTTIQRDKDDEIKILQKDLKETKNLLSSCESKLTKEIEDLKNKQDEKDQNDKRDTLIITGPEMPRFQMGENLKNTVQDMFQQKMNFRIGVEDISTVYRLGPKPTSQEDRRPIIFRVNNRDLVPQIYRACRQQKPPFFVNQSLTPLRSKIFYSIRQLKRKFPSKIDGCRNSEGRLEIFLKKPADLSSGTEFNSKRIVKCQKDLDSVLCELGISYDAISA